MALNMRSSFLGSSLKAGPASSTPQIGKVQTQALFGRKKPEKVAKSGTIKLGGAVKQVLFPDPRTFSYTCMQTDKPQEMQSFDVVATQHFGGGEEGLT